MKRSSATTGSVLQGYFRIERFRGAVNRAEAAQPKGPARATPQPPRPDLLPAKMRVGTAQAKAGHGSGGAWTAATRPELLPGMGPARMGGPYRVAQARSGHEVSTTPIPAGRLRVIGKGRPLEPGIRQTMERFFQADFSGVRVHEGPAARAMGALAFTLGEELHFAPGLYDPATREGVELLGHELTHVVQQRDGRVANPYGQGVAIVQDPALEAEADRMGQKIADEMWSGRRTGQPVIANGGLPHATTNPALMQTRAMLQRVPNGFRATLPPPGPTSLVDSPALVLPKWSSSLRAGIAQLMEKDITFPEKNEGSKKKEQQKKHQEEYKKKLRSLAKWIIQESEGCAFVGGHAEGKHAEKTTLYLHERNLSVASTFETHEDLEQAVFHVFLECGQEIRQWLESNKKEKLSLTIDMPDDVNCIALVRRETGMIGPQKMLVRKLRYVVCILRQEVDDNRGIWGILTCFPSNEEAN